MDIGAVLAGLALMVAVVAYLARPMVERRGQAVSAEDHEVSLLLAERDRVLSSLQDLEMDRAMGKIMQHDYERQRQELFAEGAEVLRRLDQIQSGGAAENRSSEDGGLEAEIEAEVAALRGDAARGGETHFCPSCGVEVQPSDRFCTRCGEPLSEEMAT